MGVKKVLILEDETLFYKLWNANLHSDSRSQELSLLFATNVSEAEALLWRNPDVALIVTDACTDPSRRSVMNTGPFVKWARNKVRFVGPMMAMSSCPEYRQELLMAGCDHECHDKSMLIRNITDVLSSQLADF